MMMKKSKILLSILFIILIGIAGCGDNSENDTGQVTIKEEVVEDAWKSGPSKRFYKCESRNWIIKTFTLEEGEKISFEFWSEIEKGEFEILIKDPKDKVIGTLEANTEGTVEILGESEGEYIITAVVDAESGSFNIRETEVD